MPEAVALINCNEGSSIDTWVLSLWCRNSRIGYLSKAYSVGRSSIYAYSHTDPMDFARIYKSERDAEQYLNACMDLVVEFLIEGNCQYDCAYHCKEFWSLSKDGKIVEQFADMHIEIEKL